MNIRNSSKNLTDTILGAYLAYTVRRNLNVPVTYYCYGSDWLWFMDEVSVKRYGLHSAAKGGVIDINADRSEHDRLGVKAAYCKALGLGKNMRLQIPMVVVKGLTDPINDNPYVVITLLES